METSHPSHNLQTTEPEEDFIEMLKDILDVEYNEKSQKWEPKVNHPLFSNIINWGIIKPRLESLPPEVGIDKVKEILAQEIIKSTMNIEESKRIPASMYPGVLSLKEARNLYYPEIPSYRGFIEFLKRIIKSLPIFYREGSKKTFSGVSVYIDEESLKKTIKIKLRKIWREKFKVGQVEIFGRKDSWRDRGIIFENSVKGTHYFPILQFINTLSYFLNEYKDYQINIQMFKATGRQDKDKFTEFFTIKSDTLKSFYKEAKEVGEFSWIAKFCLDSYKASPREKKDLIVRYIDKLSEIFLKYEEVDYLIVRQIVDILSTPTSKGIPLKQIFVVEVVGMDRKEIADRYFKRFYAIFSKVYNKIKEHSGSERAKMYLKRIFYDLRNELNKERFARKLIEKLGELEISIPTEDLFFENLNDFYLKSSIILNTLVFVIERSEGGEER